MHLELKANKEDLEFIEEMIHNILPFREDLLIIKKQHSYIVQNEIGEYSGSYSRATIPAVQSHYSGDRNVSAYLPFTIQKRNVTFIQC